MPNKGALVLGALAIGGLLLATKKSDAKEQQPSFSPGDILGPGGPVFQPGSTTETTTVTQTVPSGSAHVSSPEPEPEEDFGSQFQSNDGSSFTSHDEPGGFAQSDDPEEDTNFGNPFLA